MTVAAVQPDDDWIDWIWKSGQNDEAWPIAFRAREAFVQHVDGYSLAESWGEGLLRLIMVNGTCIGYLVLHRVAETYVHPDLGAVEGGTYLLPGHRGAGWNRRVKSMMVELAQSRLQALHCLFVVPVSNTRAAKGLAKLGWPWRVYNRETGGPFAKFIQRKEWETGESVQLYVIPLNQPATYDKLP